MKYAPILLILILVVLLVATWGRIDTYSLVTDRDWIATETKNVKQDVQNYLSAVREFDVEPMIELAHASVLLSEGGEETVRRFLQQGFTTAQQTGVSFDDFTILGEPEFYRTKYDDFAVIRTKLVVSSPENTVWLIGYFVGHKKQHEGSWKYFDASGGTANAERTIKYHLEEFPELLTLPECSTKIFASREPAELETSEL